MRKVPSYLKGLADTRARAAGDVERLTRISDEVLQKLTVAQTELEACDRLIKKYDSRLNPALINPIHAWQGRYGKRGALRESVRRLIQEAWPEEITTTEISWALQMEYKLNFATASEKKKWQDNSVRGAIVKMMDEGLVERLHDISAPTSEVGRWRWKTDSCLSLDHLRELAEASGVKVQECDDGPS